MKKICSIALFIFSLFFLIIQTVAVQHVHLDENGEAHSHSHILLKDKAPNYEPIELQHLNLLNAGQAGHIHTHKQLHMLDFEFVYYKYLTSQKFSFLKSICKNDFSSSSFLIPALTLFSATVVQYLKQMKNCWRFYAMKLHLNIINSTRLNI